jgi:hypothetical protein
MLTVHHSISVQLKQRDVLLFNLLRIMGLYMFRELFAYPQEGLHKQHLVYCVCVMSVGCTILAQPTDITRKKYTKCRCVAPPEDEQVILEICRGP